MTGREMNVILAILVK